MSDLFGATPQRQEIGDEHNRYLLMERWSAGPLIGFAGMNPSYASATRTDQTWTRWRGFAHRWGFGGQLVANPAPFRSACPDDAVAILRAIDAGQDWHARDRLIRNDEVVRQHASLPAAWVLGWGDGGGKMDAAFPIVDSFVTALIEEDVSAFYVFGLTKSQNPMHVLARGKARIPDEAPLYRYEPGSGQLGEQVTFRDGAAA